MPLARSKDLELECEVEPEVPEWVRVDAHRLGQVLTHLVGNAVKFTEGGRVVLRIGVEKRLGAARFKLRFTVQDTGPGIAAEGRAFLFEPFVRAGLSPGSPRHGAGLGLPISQRLLELMGSELEVESTLGEGSRFSFVLELEVAEATDTSSVRPPSKTGAKARVLLVEDEEVSRLVELRLLQSLGLEVVAVRNGQEALDAVGASPFDLVVMDCQMPVMDGYEATREIRRREGSEGHTPIVALTAHALTGDRDRCLAAGMDDFVPKPVGRGTLADVLSSWVEIEDSP
jgi:CheY-like chemotaxis protein